MIGVLPRRVRRDLGRLILRYFATLVELSSDLRCTPAGRRPPASPVHLDPASSSRCCVGYGLAAFCPYHSCLRRYKALADYPSSRRSPTLRSRRRLPAPSGLPTAWQTGPQHVACLTRYFFLRHPHSMDADPHQSHQLNEYGNGQWGDVGGYSTG